MSWATGLETGSVSSEWCWRSWQQAVPPDPCASVFTLLSVPPGPGGTPARPTFPARVCPEALAPRPSVLGVSSPPRGRPSGVSAGWAGCRGGSGVFRAGRAAVMPVVAAHVPHSPLKARAAAVTLHLCPFQPPSAVAPEDRTYTLAVSGQLFGFLSLVLCHGLWGGSWASIPGFSHTDGGLCPVSPKVRFDRLEVLGSHILSLRTLTVSPWVFVPGTECCRSGW